MASPEPRFWFNGSILGPGIAEALYVEGGRVVTLGDRASVERSVPTGAERIDLHGRCVIPGLVDAHLHVAASVRARNSVGLAGTRDLAALRDRVEAHLRDHPGPVLGGGWDQEELAEGRMPTRADLDRIRTDEPVALYRRCGHVAVLNSAALAAAGLSGATPDPPNGRLGRSGGTLDGLLYDGAMAPLAALEDRWLPVTPPQVRAWLKEAASVGLTALGSMSADPEELAAVRTALGTDPPVRIRAYLRTRWLPELVRLRTELGSASLRVNGVKVMADGSLGARTAWLNEPYSDAPDLSGTSLVPEETLIDVLQRCAAVGAATAVHAIGDRTLGTVLRAFDTVPGRGPVRIEHASLSPLPLIERAARLSVPLVVQPSFVPSDGWIPERLGPARARWSYPFRTMLEHGLVVAGSSDAPIETRDPWRGLAAACAPRPSGVPESLDPRQALRVYTEAGSTAIGEIGAGTLAPGTPADLVVLRVPRWEEAIALGAECVASTYLEGRQTFAAPISRTREPL